MQEKENQLIQEISNKESVSTKEVLEELNSNVKKETIVYTKAFRKAYGIKLNPVKRDSPKIGRNEKCPCGSGLKYKKCCIKDKEK